MISLGGTMIDNNGVVQRWPAQSLMTGLIGNSLGYDHSESEKLTTLQSRLRFATRCDVVGEVMIDYQTVDLGQSFMSETGWTTWGAVEERKGGSAKTGTHIRYKHYFVDSVFTVALSLIPSDPHFPTLDTIEESLMEPSRPLFIGRKCCIPSVPILLGKISANSFLEALRKAPLLQRLKGKSDFLYEIYLPSGEYTAELESAHEFSVTDERDWINQIHTGRRLMTQAFIKLSDG
ncbi:type I-E CRISPR-associated protein Cas5/CasD [bacterium]|nr:type I-E CRISPR-associated protein Cas5/CasD [candidate division CSSED10-310 bacterium]